METLQKPTPNNMPAISEIARANAEPITLDPNTTYTDEIHDPSETHVAQTEVSALTMNDGEDNRISIVESADDFQHMDEFHDNVPEDVKAQLGNPDDHEQ